MSDFVRNLIKWILVVILAILVIFLIVKVANRDKKVEKENPVTPIVDTTHEKSTKKNDKKEESETTTEKEAEKESTTATAEGEVSAEGTALIVNAEDTGTTRGLTGVIGIVIIGSTTFFLLKSRKTVEE